MAAVTDRSSALACVPDAIAPEERAAHFALARKLFTELAEERSAEELGYAFRFRNDAYGALVSFIANERKCCPFMTFELTIAPHSEFILLRMTGPAGTRAVLEAELDLADSCGCGEK